MQRQNVRVILASENPEVRHFLKEVVEEDGAVIVGQAQDASRALTLARNLRPDVALVDCWLPHAVGQDTVPLSRMSGLDTAQAISEEIPNTRVILLNNLDTEILAGRGLGSDVVAIFSVDRMGVNTPFALQDLCDEVGQPNAPVFADVEVKQLAALQQKTTRMSDKVIFFGAIGFAFGWLITLTVFLAPVGVPIAAVGAATAILGLLGKLTASIWRNKIKSATNRGQLTK